MSVLVSFSRRSVSLLSLGVVNTLAAWTEPNVEKGYTCRVHLDLFMLRNLVGEFVFVDTNQGLRPVSDPGSADAMNQLAP